MHRSEHHQHCRYNNSCGTRRHQQSGLVLITVALFLVVLAALGAASMRSASVQERIAGIFYDRAVALASSESALSEGKEFLLAPNFDTSSASSKVRDGSTLYSSATNDGLSVSAWVTSDTNWASGIFALILGSLDGVTGNLLRVPVKPSYIVDRFPDMGYSTTTKFQVFRVTARGAGGRSENAVYTQLLYRVPVSTGS